MRENIEMFIFMLNSSKKYFIKLFNMVFDSSENLFFRRFAVVNIAMITGQLLLIVPFFITAMCSKAFENKILSYKNRKYEIWIKKRIYY